MFEVYISEKGVRRLVIYILIFQTEINEDTAFTNG
jgi:hypothetical protein